MHRSRNQLAAIPVLAIVFLFGFQVLLNSCGSHSDKAAVEPDSSSLIELPSPDSVSKSEFERIRNISKNWFDTVLIPRGFNGGMLVAKNGQIIFEKYRGTGHLPGTDSINQNSMLHIASVTKTFTAMAVLKLMQDEKLNLDDEFSKYFPEFNFPGVTVRCLLNHRSGLPNYNYYMENLGWDQSKFVTNRDVMNYLVKNKQLLPDVLTPDTHFSYCNTNYALLALLIEKISGQSYAQFLQDTFFTPLRMNNTYVFDIADSLKALPSYNWRGKPEALNFLDNVYGDKNIYTSVRDLFTWDRALRSNLIFTPATLDQAYAPYSNEKPGTRNYGLGWRMNIFSTGMRQDSGKKIIYHNGWWHGSNATFIRLLKENATIIVIGNKFTRAIYHAKVLTSAFGDYYSPIDEETIEPAIQLNSVLVDSAKKYQHNKGENRADSNSTKKNLYKQTPVIRKTNTPK